MKKQKNPTIEIKLNDYHDTIVKALIKAKTKETKAEKKMIYSGIFLLGLILVGCIYIYFLLKTRGHGSSYLSFIMGNKMILFWILCIICNFFYFDSKAKNFEKAEKDYEELVEDIIDRSSDIWNSDELQDEKGILFHELKEKYDINLYHK